MTSVLILLVILIFNVAAVCVVGLEASHLNAFGAGVAFMGLIYEYQARR